MRAPQQPINPPKPNFPDMGVTDWYQMAMVDTRFKPDAKIAFETPEQPAPSVPRFSEQPCPRWTAKRQHSLGGEDTRPADMAASVLPGRTAYQIVAEDDGDGDVPNTLQAPAKRAPSALQASIAGRGKKPSPPPTRK